jgi:hypothetical protein
MQMPLFGGICHLVGNKLLWYDVALGIACSFCAITPISTGTFSGKALHATLPGYILTSVR